jgi:hypothetical protein
MRRKEEPEEAKVRLRRPLTIAGKNYEKGDVIPVSLVGAPLVEVWKERGIATHAAAGAEVAEGENDG